MTYNRNSAITTLIRTGNSLAGYGNMDFLQYAYVGNKLKSINDMGSSNVYDGAFEFVDGSSNTLESGTTLEIDGGLLKNIILDAKPGSSVIIKNGGRLLGNKQHGEIIIPVGVNLDISEGEMRIND